MAVAIKTFSVGNSFLLFIATKPHGSKVDMFWEDHKSLRNLHLTFDCMYCGQKLGEDFAKLCGLLRIYEPYIKNF